MGKNILCIFYVALLLAAVCARKKFRKDYIFDFDTDSFYKLHLNPHSNLTRQQVCANEGASLLAPMTYQELLQDHASATNTEDEELQWILYRDQQINLPTEAQDVLEMICRVNTEYGSVTTIAVFENLPFICKIHVDEVPYNSQCRVNADGYHYYPSTHRCYKVSQISYTWRKAAAECQAEGAYLAIVNTEQEATVLKKLLDSTDIITDSYDADYFHMGFRAVNTTEPRIFKTIFNQTLEEAGYSTWADNNPNNGWGEEHCGSFFKNEGKLNDIRCNIKHPFICEKEI